MIKKTLLIIFGIALFHSCEESEKLNLSTMYYNGDILTMVGNTPNYVDAIVEKDGKIIFTGSSEEAMKVAGKGHNMIDLEGKTLVPGFIDGHCHFANFGAQAIGAQLLASPDANVDDMETLISVLKEWNTSKNRALTGWIYGTGFDDSILKEKRFPTKHDLDEVSTEFPIMITHISK